VGYLVFENPSASQDGGNSTLYVAAKRAVSSSGDQLVRLFGASSISTSGDSEFQILNPGTYAVKFRVDATTGGVETEGDLTVKGDTTLGDGVGDTVTCGGAFRPREVVYTTSMNADVAGTEGEMAYCTTDNTFYGCTATGTPGSWASLH